MLCNRYTRQQAQAAIQLKKANTSLRPEFLEIIFLFPGIILPGKEGLIFKSPGSLLGYLFCK